MTIAAKAKQQLADLQDTLELIKESEIEARQFQNAANYCKAMGGEPTGEILKNLEESKNLLNQNIEKWNEIISNAKITIRME